MAGIVSFEPNKDFEDEINQQRGVQATRHAYAEQAAMGARAVGAAIADTGNYARSIEVDGGTVYSTDPGAPYIEFGSVNNPPFAPLRRGVDGTGVIVTNDGSEPGDSG